MDKKGEIPQMGVIIMLAVTVIFGIALMTQVIDDQNKLTNKIPSVNESTNLSINCYDLSAAAPKSFVINTTNSNCNLTGNNVPDSTDWQGSGGDISCPMTNVVVYNRTGGALTESTDYNVYADEFIVNFLDTDATNRTSMGEFTLISYDFCDDGYNQDGGARGVAGIISLFMALALLAAMVIGFREWTK